MPRFTFQLSEDGNHAKLIVAPIHVPGVATPLEVKIDFDATAIDGMIKDLGRLRAQLPSAVPATLGIEAAMHGTLNPAWHHGIDGMTGSSVLSLRHPGFGWLNFLIPKHECGYLAGLLKETGDAAPPVSKRKN